MNHPTHDSIKTQRAFLPLRVGGVGGADGERGGVRCASHHLWVQWAGSLSTTIFGFMNGITTSLPCFPSPRRGHTWQGFWLLGHAAPPSSRGLATKRNELFSVQRQDMAALFCPSAVIASAGETGCHVSQFLAQQPELCVVSKRLRSPPRRFALPEGFPLGTLMGNA